MNSLILISPYKAWGFKPILSGKTRNQSRQRPSPVKSQISNRKAKIG